MHLQEQLDVLTCLLEIDSWNPGAGAGLAACITAAARACSNSLEFASYRFNTPQLLQVSTIWEFAAQAHACVGSTAVTVDVMF